VVLGDLDEDRDAAAMRHLLDAGFAHAGAGQDARCGPTWPGATSSRPSPRSTTSWASA
jgi:hypothetical protein